MPPKGSKVLHEKQKQIGLLATKKKQLSSMEQKINDLDKQINNLEHRLSRKRKRIEDLNLALSGINASSQNVPFPILTINAAKRRKKNPTNENLSDKSKQRRRNETYAAAQAIHGSSEENPFPSLDGMIDTMTCKFPLSVVGNRIVNNKPKLKRIIEQNFHKDFKKSYYQSHENKMRSLNVYYGHHVLGKRKYINQRTANQCPEVANFIPYKDLAELINNIDIGTIINIDPVLTDGLADDEIGEGMFRDLRTYALRLVKFYLRVDQRRLDKLKVFENFEKKDPESVLFLMCIGGDEAPSAGTSFLVSFLNVGKRVASSFENYLIFGANVKENGSVVRRYLKLLLGDIKFLENTIFTIDLAGKTVKVEFKLHGLPNDMKMLAFLAGELTNASTYFTTFANVAKHDARDLSKEFSLRGDKQWKPFSYSKRLNDAEKVSKKKQQIKKRQLQKATERNAVTTYISTQLQSRQEEKPLFEEYIDLARCEPLHLKNNCTKELFMKVLDIVISESKLATSIKSFNDVAENNLFHKFIMYVKSDMNSNYLAKKLIAWFNENKESAKERPFGFRFRGKESFNYLRGFPQLFDMLRRNINSDSTIKRLYQIFYQSLQLRKIVSYSVRIEDTDFSVKDMTDVGRKLFLSIALHESSITPSMWCFSVVAPEHCADTLNKLNLGLGLFTMEGREQKHQQIKKYAHNSTVQKRWPYIFRHEFIQLIHLRENGFDQIRYRKRSTTYLPLLSEGKCKCSLELFDGKCLICDSNHVIEIEKKVMQNFSVLVNK